MRPTYFAAASAFADSNVASPVMPVNAKAKTIHLVFDACCMALLPYPVIGRTRVRVR
jgi:hypothetical protein